MRRGEASRVVVLMEREVGSGLQKERVDLAGATGNLPGLASYHPLNRAEFYEMFKRETSASIDHEMLERIFADFANAFITLEHIPASISVFGSARTECGTADYELAHKVGFELGKQGFGVITGGGPGIMEAAARGGRDAGTVCTGLNILLPKEQLPNPFLDVVANFEYFFARKVMFAKLSDGFIVMPGGFGTMDELFEILTLRQTAKMPDRPVVLVGHEYWDPLVDFLRNQMLERGYISPHDMDSIIVTDSPTEAVRLCVEKKEEGRAWKLAA